MQFQRVHVMQPVMSSAVIHNTYPDRKGPSQLLTCNEVQKVTLFCEEEDIPQSKFICILQGQQQQKQGSSKFFSEGIQNNFPVTLYLYSMVLTSTTST